VQYIKEVLSYPLLSQEEEVKYATMLQNPENNKLLVIRGIDSYKVSSLNTSLLFRSLINCSSYDSIIDNLLVLYSKLNSHSIDSDIVYKYKLESKKVNRALNSDELKELFNIDDGDNLEEIELLNEVKKFINYKFAFDKLYVSNLRLVVSYAKGYQKKMELIDLINEGNVGLFKAVLKYDVSLGYRFSTYATAWIKQSIRRAVINNYSIITLPENIYTSVSAFKNEVDRLEKEHGRTLTIKEIADYLSIPLKKVDDYFKYINMHHKVSLDQPIKEGEDSTLKDILPTDDNTEEMIMEESISDDIKTLFSVLTEKEQEVIKLRYGIGDDSNRARTYLEVAKLLSVSVARIRQIETKAMIKMRRFAQSSQGRSLKLYLK